MAASPAALSTLWILGLIAEKSLLEWRPEFYNNTLHAIAVGYLVASVALLHLRTRGQISLLASLLLGYWALLALVPFSGYSAGTLERDANLGCTSIRRSSVRFATITISLGCSAASALRLRCLWALWPAGCCGVFFDRPEVTAAGGHWRHLNGGRPGLEPGSAD